MAILNSGIVAPTGGYQIERSLRFNSADSAYLNRTPASAGNRKTWTWSGWVKKAFVNSNGMLFAAGSGSLNEIMLDFTAGGYEDQLRIVQFTSSSVQAQQITTAKFRDPSAWYHVVFSIDTTQATAANRWRIYVNGVEQTAWAVNTQPSQNLDTWVNSTNSHLIGARLGGSIYFNGYLTEINFIDGQALTPSSFGETDTVTGVWKPKKYTGSYSGNSFYLNFSDNSGTTSTTLGKDSSGLGNNWTPNNFSVTAGAGNDSLVDTPTNYGTDTGVGGEVRGNYATLNPLSTKNTPTINNGNLDFVGVNTSSYRISTGTIGTSSGKWYWEATINVAPGTGENASVGITSKAFASDITNSYLGNQATEWGLLLDSGPSDYAKSHSTLTSYSTAVSNGDVVQIAYDIDAGKIWFGRNGTWFASGDPATGANAAYTDLVAGTTYYPAANILCDTGNTFSLNFGQRPFAYTAPSGFKALVTTNLPTPTVVQGDDYFNTILYTGTGLSNARTGVGFQPDLVWIKERNASADHALYDAVRGVQQQLESNTTTDETTESTGLTAFGSDGFTVGSLAQVNTNNDTYVAWCWKESTTSKFDIVTYTGNGTARTISHNLGVVPNMIIVKARTTASTDQGWPVYHSANTANPETDYLLLNTTAATADLDTVWNDTAPTSSVFSVGTNALVNANNDTYVAYLFANVAGYSAFGSYTGNGSADGPFVFTGFRPAFVLTKRTDSTAAWYVHDTARNTFNVCNLALSPDLADAEVSANNNMDILSNGFKIRNSGAWINASGGTYIYMALASNPFKYSLAR